MTVVEPKRDVGVAEGGAGDGGDDMAELGAFGLQELEAGGDGPEEAAHGHARAASAAGWVAPR